MYIRLSSILFSFLLYFIFTLTIYYHLRKTTAENKRLACSGTMGLHYEVTLA